jgi:hypothetical protein
MTQEIRRKTPEEFLRACQAEEAAQKKGHLKIFFGYASGAGKSFRMLDEARRRRERARTWSSERSSGRCPRKSPPCCKSSKWCP